MRTVTQVVNLHKLQAEDQRDACCLKAHTKYALIQAQSLPIYIYIVVCRVEGEGGIVALRVVYIGVLINTVKVAIICVCVGGRVY